MMAKVIAGCDVVIATAAVPGKKAPVLITAEMVDGHGPRLRHRGRGRGAGGQLRGHPRGGVRVRNGVTVMGPVNLAATVPYHASQMYARNVSGFLALIVKDGALKVDTADDIVRETLVARGGEVVASEGPRGARAGRAGGGGRLSVKKKKTPAAKGARTKGAPAKDVDAYIAAVPPEARVMLNTMRRIVKAAAPKARERISYRIPLYEQHGHLVGFAAWKTHCTLYVVSTKKLDAGDIAPYLHAKTSLHFPLDEPLPAALVRKIVKTRLKENEGRAKE